MQKIPLVEWQSLSRLPLSYFTWNESSYCKHFSDVDKKNPWKGLESRAGNLLGAITMPLFAAHVYANFRWYNQIIDKRTYPFEFSAFWWLFKAFLCFLWSRTRSQSAFCSIPSATSDHQVPCQHSQHWAFCRLSSSCTFCSRFWGQKPFRKCPCLTIWHL